MYKIKIVDVFCDILIFVLLFIFAIFVIVWRNECKKILTSLENVFTFLDRDKIFLVILLIYSILVVTFAECLRMFLNKFCSRSILKK